jgi:hypothetical protein
MVEYLEIGQSCQYNMDISKGIDEQRARYKVGRKFYCTVPDLSGTTLLPIIYRHCAEYMIIRSDSRTAHYRICQDVIQGRVLDSTADYDQGGLHFRFQQQDVFTMDQVCDHPNANGIPQSAGMLQANRIESFWCPSKEFVEPKYRNVKDCPGKLMEYLWHELNKRDLGIAVNCALRELVFDANVPLNMITEFISEKLTARGENGEIDH